MTSIAGQVAGGRSKPATKDKRQASGRPYFEHPLKVNQPRGKRPDAERIRSWLDRRRHVREWRNRDGSYDAIVTVYGKNAWARIRNLALSAPRTCYIAFRYQVWRDEKAPTTRIRRSRSPDADMWDPKRKKVRSNESTFTVRARRQSVDWALTLPMGEGDNLVQTMAGLAVYWPAK